MSVVEKAMRIIEDSSADRRYALETMQRIQAELNYIPEEALTALAKHLNCYTAELYAMATFYKALSLKPKGRHIIKICDGTACHIRGATNLVTGIERTLGIRPGETTEDGEFSLELVSCLGACAIAPVMVVDGQYHGKVTMEQLPDIFEEVRNSSKEVSS